MKAYLAIAVAALIGTLLAAGSPSPAGAAGGPAGAKGKPLMAFGGTDSRVQKRAYHRITTDEQWGKIFTAHEGAGSAAFPRMQVDFDRCTVVALFDGARSNTSALEVESVTETPDAVVVRFDFPGYATAGNVEPNRVTPYGFVVVPKTDKPIVLEKEDSTGRKSDNPPPRSWKEVARLAKP